MATNQNINWQQKEFADLITKAREIKGLNQSKVAELAKIGYSYYNKLEKCTTVYPPKEKVLERFAKILDLDLDQILILCSKMPRSQFAVFRKHYKQLFPLLEKIDKDPAFANQLFASVQKSG
jgi:transcriptional regulator with XRE-family HTH domain